ncbi:unnamed protein product [Pleuronectes platessa]|uniref:Uncharacterized protein n=1 Tax=Pleuronectes platessa TaxID=8262 RepID=A0A9N7TIW9_PLEPL|nr:unnamed protein product [Pleuronectes platessa]
MSFSPPPPPQLPVKDNHDFYFMAPPFSPSLVETRPSRRTKVASWRSRLRYELRLHTDQEIESGFFYLSCERQGPVGVDKQAICEWRPLGRRRGRGGGTNAISSISVWRQEVMRRKERGDEVEVSEGWSRPPPEACARGHSAPRGSVVVSAGSCGNQCQMASWTQSGPISVHCSPLSNSFCESPYVPRPSHITFTHNATARQQSNPTPTPTRHRPPNLPSPASRAWRCGSPKTKAPPLQSGALPPPYCPRHTEVYLGL